MQSWLHCNSFFLLKLASLHCNSFFVKVGFPAKQIYLFLSKLASLHCNSFFLSKFASLQNKFIFFVKVGFTEKQIYFFIKVGFTAALFIAFFRYANVGYIFFYVNDIIQTLSSKEIINYEREKGMKNSLLIKLTSINYMAQKKERISTMVWSKKREVNIPNGTQNVKWGVEQQENREFVVSGVEA